MAEQEEGAVILPFQQVEVARNKEASKTIIARAHESHSKNKTTPSYSLESIRERLGLDGDEE